MKEIDRKRIGYLVLEYKETRNDRAYEELYEMLLEYSVGVLNKFKGYTSSSSHYEEITSIIHQALFDALLMYDSSRNAQFTTFYYYHLKEKCHDRILENANTLSAPRLIKKTLMADISLDIITSDDEITDKISKNDNYFDLEYIEDFGSYLCDEQRNALITSDKNLSKDFETKKEENFYESKRRLKILYKYYKEINEESSLRAVYLIGIKRLLVDGIPLSRVTREINDALNGAEYRKNEMSAALLYVFRHLRSRYPALRNPAFENLLQAKPEESVPINPIELEIITNIIRKEVEKCLNY